jgi:hypothetical protein
MSGHSTLRGRAPGNREVSRPAILAGRGDRSGAGGEAIYEEGGEPKASEERGVFA